MIWKPKLVVEVEPTRPIWLMSDLHIGTRTSNLSLIRSYIDRAKNENALVIINGDVFDAIHPADKRYELSGQTEHESNFVNIWIERAVELLRPIRTQILCIGLGNHETKFIKQSGIDLISCIITLLSDEKHTIVHGGYHGIIRFINLELKRQKQRCYTDLYYHHGYGSAPKTGPHLKLSDLYAQVPDADIVWIGHLHQPMVSTRQHYRQTAYGYTLAHSVLVATGGFTQPSENPYPDYNITKGRVVAAPYPVAKVHLPKSRNEPVQVILI